MTIRLNFLRETEKARLYEFKSGQSTWIPRSAIKSTLKFPSDLGSAQVHELNVEDWWWDKYMEEEEPA